MRLDSIIKARGAVRELLKDVRHKLKLPDALKLCNVGGEAKFLSMRARKVDGGTAVAARCP